jgi:hypothetical protein
MLSELSEVASHALHEEQEVPEIYLGSCRKLSHAEALEKARKVKKEALEI